VAFRSAAANLVPGDGGGKTDIFLKDTSGGSVKRISTDMAGNEADGDSDKPAISADGRFIAFSSDATNLVPDDTNGQVDVFLKDAQTGAISLISTNAAGEQGDEANGFTSLAISADGRYVAFDSRSTNMVPDDTNQKADIFLKDTQTGQITPISADPSGQLGLEDSYSSVSLSADGRLVAFSSDAPNLVAGDTNNKRDVFLKNTATGAVTIISADAAGAQASGKSDNPSISADGRLVAFESDAANLAPSGSRGKTEIYLKDLETDEVRRISSSSTQD
jgi:Tol biopolymer transport system component